MYSILQGTYSAHFNSDLSGHVTLQAGADEVTVPAELLVRLVAQYIRMERISALEGMTDLEVLGLEEDS